MYSRHGAPTSADEQLARQLQLAETGDIPCKYWRRGNCRDGSKCLYSHAEPPGLGDHRPQQQQQQSSSGAARAQPWSNSTRVSTPPQRKAHTDGSDNGGFAVARHQRGGGEHQHQHQHQHQQQHQQRRRRHQPHGTQENSALFLPGVDNMTYEQLLELEEKMGSVKIGLRPDQIQRIPTTTVRTQPPQNTDPCSICLEKITVGDTIRSLPCDHSFHVECIDEWLKEHRQCPVCKRDVTLVASSVGEVLDKMLKS